MLLAMITVKRLYEIRVDIDDSLPVDDVFSALFCHFVGNVQVLPSALKLIITAMLIFTYNADLKSGLFLME
jgi:hypothetical protein